MTYAQRLKELRQKQGLSQAQVAMILQTTQQYYGKYENEERPLPIWHLVTLCKFYRVSADWVLGLNKSAEVDEGTKSG